MKHLVLVAIATALGGAACAPAAATGLPSHGSASLEAPAPTIAPRRALGAAVFGGRVFAVGGWSGSATQLDTVEVFDGVHWIAGPALGVARSQHGLVSLDAALGAVGGWRADGGLVSEVEALRADETAWRVATHLPTPRREPGVAVWDGRIVVAGGFDGTSDGDLDGYQDLVEAYEPETDTWSRLPRMNEPRRGLTLVAIEDALYAIGGYNASGYSGVVERYDPEPGRWSVVDWPIVARTWAAAVVVDGDVIVAGGYDGTGYLGLVERIDPDSGAVCQPPALDTPRAWLAAVALSGRVLTLGGETSTGIGGAAEWIETQCR